MIINAERDRLRQRERKGVCDNTHVSHTQTHTHTHTHTDRQRERQTRK